MTRVIAFDVNETLLDLRVLDEPFAHLVGDSGLRPVWFAQMLQLSFVGGLTGHYVDFRRAQEAALRMVATRVGRALADSDVTAMVDRMNALPPHDEVPAAIERLAGTDLVLVALVNSLHAVGEQQLVNANIREYFHSVVSADSVQALKPAPAPYQKVAADHDVAIDEVRLVAAHSWDISGALAAGCQAAFVARPGMVLSPIGAQPDIVGEDIADVVDQIIEKDL
jgi:2-haloacid dehalogenase